MYIWACEYCFKTDLQNIWTYPLTLRVKRSYITQQRPCTTFEGLIQLHRRLAQSFSHEKNTRLTAHHSHLGGDAWGKFSLHVQWSTSSQRPSSSSILMSRWAELGWLTPVQLVYLVQWSERRLEEEPQLCRSLLLWVHHVTQTQSRSTEYFHTAINSAKISRNSIILKLTLPITALLWTNYVLPKLFLSYLPTALIISHHIHQCWYSAASYFTTLQREMYLILHLTHTTVGATFHTGFTHEINYNFIKYDEFNNQTACEMVQISSPTLT